MHPHLWHIGVVWKWRPVKSFKDEGLDSKILNIAQHEVTVALFVLSYSFWQTFEALAVFQ